MVVEEEEKKMEELQEHNYSIQHKIRIQESSDEEDMDEAKHL